MEYDISKVDEMTLALLYLTHFQQTKDFPFKAWKGHDWDVLNRLYDKGYIYDPKNKNKSIVFTEEGFDLCSRLFREHFGVDEKKQ